MELQALQIGHFRLEYVECKKDNWRDATVLRFKIINTSDRGHSIRFKTTRYNSKVSGIKDLLCSAPTDLYRSDGYKISANSFMYGDLYFEIKPLVCVGDFLELVINERWEILVEYAQTEEGLKWLVVENTDKNIDRKQNYKVLEKHIVNNIERFESMEEKVGITLQKFKAKVDKDDDELKTFNLCFEIISISDQTKECYLQMVMYDKEGDILYKDDYFFEGENFLGFEVVEFEDITLDEPISEISKIRLYPKL